MSESKKNRENSIPCEVVQDLLPLYVDGVTNEVTTEMVKEHIGQCTSCREEYDVLCTEFPQDEAENTKTKGKFDAMMKIMRRRRVRVTILTVLITCLLCGGVGYVVSEVRMIPFNKVEAQVKQVYKYDTEKGSKFFIIYEQNIAAYANSTFNEWIEMEGAVGTWKIDGKRTILRPDLKEYPTSMSYSILEVEENCKELRVNGQVVWSEEENGSDKIPAYVYEFENPKDHETCVMDENEGYFAKIYDDEREIRWDFAGNVIYDGEPIG